MTGFYMMGTLVVKGLMKYQMFSTPLSQLLNFDFERHNA